MESSNMKHVDTTNWAVRLTTWVSSLAVLNLCWLLFSLPLITLIPATDAVFEVMHRWENGGERTQVFQTFFSHFKRNFLKSFKWGLPILIAAAIIIVDIYFLSTQTFTAAWFQIFKYAFYTIAFLFVLAVIYGYPLSKELDSQNVRVLLMGLFLAVGNPQVTLAVAAGFILLGVGFWFFPAMLFFFSLTGPAWIGTKAVVKIVQKKNES